jgi:2'-5' RNA ligase
MRLFVGIHLSKDMLEEVSRFIQLSSQNMASVPHGLKWTSPANLHFTLKFFGEVPLSRLNDVTQALGQALLHNEPFLLQLGKAGCFPAKGTPRVVWLGITTGESQLIKLAGSIENACLGYGFPKEDRPFSPHLTIARLKDGSPGAKFVEPKFQFTSTMLVEDFFLIESQLYPTGPLYRQVEKFHLKK